MSMWAEVKLALNNTLGRKNFKPLNEIIRAERHENYYNVLFALDNPNVRFVKKGVYEITRDMVVEGLGNDEIDSTRLYILPNGVNTISNNAFDVFAIKQWIIPQSVKIIDSGAFVSGSYQMTFLGKPNTIMIDALSPTATDIFVPWAEGEIAGAPWGAINARIHYNSEV